MNTKSQIRVISARKNILDIGFAEIWEFRLFLYVLVWREIKKIKYKQSVIGVAWVWLHPLCLMAIFDIFRLSSKNFPHKNFPYEIYILSGIIPWLFISRSISDASSCLLLGRDMLTRLYFPRLILPLTSIISNFFDLLVSFVLLLFFMIIFDVEISVNIFALPVIFIFILPLLAGLSLFVASLNVVYRDFGFIIPLALQILLFASPIVYSVEIIPEKIREIYELNPIVPFLSFIRWSLAGRTPMPTLEELLIPLFISTIIFILLTIILS